MITKVKKSKRFNTLTGILYAILASLKDLLFDNGKWFGLLLLCFFFGFLGAHRFAVKKWKSGIFYLLTLGIFGIGVIIDLIYIVRNRFTDAKWNYIKSQFTGIQRFGVFIILLAALQLLYLYHSQIPYLDETVIKIFETIQQYLQQAIKYILDTAKNI